MADVSTSGVLNAAWDGVTPATAPAGSVVGPLNIGRDSTVGVDVRGAFTATVTLELSIDGLNWYAATATTTTGAGSTNTFTTPGDKLVSTSGASLIRARCSAYTSGTATVVMAGTPGGGGGGSGGGGGGAVTIGDGADTAEGTTTDAGIITDIAGTTIGFLRGLIKQSITLLARLPAALSSGRFVVDASQVAVPITDNAGSITVDGTVTITPSGTQTVSGTVTANQGGTWTIQPGNTANTTAWKVDGSAVTQPVSAASLPLPTGAAADATITTTNTEIGGLTEAAPASDIASSGLNGRLQRIAQNITTLIAATLKVNGPGANQAAVSGNPVWIAGSTTAAGGNLQSLLIESATNPNLRASLYIGGSQLTLFTTGNSDSQPTNNLGMGVVSYPVLYNGSNFDRQRSNVEATLLTSAARTTTQVSAAITTYNCGAIMVILDMTTVGTGSVTVSIDGVEPVSGNLYNLLTGAAVTTNVRNVYVVDPAIPAVANVSAQKRLPRTIKITVNANNSNSAVYSVSYVLQPV